MAYVECEMECGFLVSHISFLKMRPRNVNGQGVRNETRVLEMKNHACEMINGLQELKMRCEK